MHMQLLLPNLLNSLQNNMLYILWTLYFYPLMLNGASRKATPYVANATTNQKVIVANYTFLSVMPPSIYRMIDEYYRWVHFTWCRFQWLFILPHVMCRKMLCRSMHVVSAMYDTSSHKPVSPCLQITSRMLISNLQYAFANVLIDWSFLSISP